MKLLLLFVYTDEEAETQAWGHMANKWAGTRIHSQAVQI